MTSPAPNYDSGTLSTVLPSVLAAVTGAGANQLQLPGTRAAVVILVDGLGAALLERWSTYAPFLRSLENRHLSAGVPSTTSTSITSLGTGVPAGVHGLVGYTSVLDVDGERPQVINWLSWTEVSTGVDLRDSYPPETTQVHPTMFERAQRLGVGTTVVSHRQFHGSGLTRAALRGARFDGVAAPADLIVKVAAAAAEPGPQLVYGYLSELDLAGHIHGPDCETWKVQLSLIDHTLAELARRLPDGTDLYVTADHGMITVDPGQVVDYDEEPQLRAGARAIAGESRLRVVFAEPGQRDAVLGRWRERLGDRADVIATVDGIDAGLFGPTVSDAARSRLGDVLAICRDRAAVMRTHAEPRLSAMIGQHGGLTPDEQLIPLLRFHC